MDRTRKPPSRRPSKSSAAPDDQQLMQALTALWLKTKHTQDQEANREAIFSTWFQDLSRWPIRHVVVVLSHLASTEEWWPAWCAVEQQLPRPADAIGYDNPWLRIQSASVRAWAQDVAKAYRDEHPGAAKAALIGQATNMALRMGDGIVGPAGLPAWDGQACHKKVKKHRHGKAA